MNPSDKYKSLKLDSYDVLMPFSITKPEIIRLLHDISELRDASSETQVIVRSKLWSLDFVFCIAFHFCGEKLTAISLSPENALAGGALYARYREIQKAMEKEYGRPRQPLQTILNALDPAQQSSRWRKGSLRIEHFLLDRFGMEERIRITL